jgi:hypothetical protein
MQARIRSLQSRCTWRPGPGAASAKIAPIRHLRSSASRCAATLKENVAKLPSIANVQRVRIPAAGDWEIPNVEGKKASVAIYAALAVQFGGKLNRESAQRGLELYAEVVEDAIARPGTCVHGTWRTLHVYVATCGRMGAKGAA